MNTYREQKINDYIDENYPNAKLVNYLDKDSNLAYYKDSELAALDGDWFPLCCFRSEDGQLVYGGRDKIVHTYTEGETGAGKTTRFVIQSIRALSSTKSKPSFVVVDIHGEIIENLYSHLKNKGYDIKILNCDDAARSDTYNPLLELAIECLENRRITPDAFNNIRRISEVIQPIEDVNDPIWDQGARSYTNGCILDKFEDLVNGDIPLSCMTLYNIIQNHYWLRSQLSGGFGSSCGNIFKIAPYDRKRSDCLSVQKMMSVTDNAEKTRASYFGVVENHYDAFSQPTFYSLSSDSTISIRDFIKKPTVIVIQSGNTRIGDALISLLMNDIYTTVVRMGKASASKRLPRKIHCFLDEFANCNIADGPEYIKMLTTSRKFGMYWHMILQCDAQLDRKFDENIGRIIRANSTEIFMGSQDYDTQVRFARSCGQKTVESLESRITKQAPSLVVVDLMTPEKLNMTEEGYIYVKTNRHQLLRSYFEAFYNCPEFEPVEDVDEIYPHNDFDFTSTCFYPTEMPPSVTYEQYEVLRYIMDDNPVTIKQLADHFSRIDVGRVFNRLTQQGIVALSGGNVVLKLGPAQIELLRYKFDGDWSGGDMLWDSLWESMWKKSRELAKEASDKAAEDTSEDASDETSDEEPGEASDEDSEEASDEEPEDASEEDDEDASEEDDEDSDEASESEDEAEESEAPAVSPLAVELKKYLDDNNITVDMAELDGLTCLPEIVRDFLKRYVESPELDCEQLSGDFPEERKRLVREIVESYLRSNNFETKEEWNRRIFDEFVIISSTNYFPDSIVAVFDSAVKKIRNGLPLYQLLKEKQFIHDRDNGIKTYEEYMKEEMDAIYRLYGITFDDYYE